MMKLLIMVIGGIGFMIMVFIPWLIGIGTILDKAKKKDWYIR